MYVKDFTKTINEIAEDIGCDGKGNTGSHAIPSHVHFYVEGDDGEYELDGIEVDRLGGCGCATGVTFRLRLL